MIVLPSQNESISAQQRATWDLVDTYLVQKTIAMPVFFTHQSPSVDTIRQQASSFSTAFDELELSVVGPVELPAPSDPRPELASFHGWLQGLSNAVDIQLPTVAIVAHYDTLAAATELANGASEASGVVALLELARLFSKIYGQPRNRVAVNFLFVVVGGSRINFAGSELWSSQMDKDIIDRIDFALCLDSLASSSLHLHFSRPPKTQKVKAVYDVFVETARSLGIPLELHRRKVVVSSDVMAFEHEVFARKHVFSMTLTSHENPSPKRSSSLDVVSSVNTTLLARNVGYVAELLFKHAFGFSGTELHAFEGSFTPDTRSMEHWLNILSSRSRVEFLLDKQVGKSPALDLIRDRLADYTQHFVNRTYAIPAGVQFRDSRGETILKASLVRSPFFHLGLFVVVLAYLAGVFFAIDYLTKGRVDVYALLDVLGIASKTKRA